MSRYRCIFIDWHNTLSTSLFWDHSLAQSADQEHQYARLRASLFVTHHELIVPWMRGMLSTEMVMEVVAQDTGLSVDLVMTEFITSCQQMRLVSARIPALIAALRARGSMVAIATDNMDSFLRWTVPAMNLSDSVDTVLCSSSIGALKGDGDANRSLFFHHILHEWALEPGESLLLDDSPTLISTVQRFGIDAWQITAQRDVVNALEQLLTYEL